MKVKYIAIPAGLCLVAFLAGRWSKPSGSADPQPSHDHSADTESGDTVWTCSMHPQIQQPEPGDCPICAMDLIPLINDGGDPGPRAMQMSESALALADIETTAVERKWIERQTRLVGRLAIDETRERSLTARFPARVETLYVNYDGVPVKTGDHLANVYSPDLFAAQSELLTAMRHDPESPLARAAREKLRLWGLLPEQIEEIIQRGKADERMEIKAPIGGVVVEKQIHEGEYLKTGQPLFRIADLSVLWLTLEAYESDLPWLRYGQRVAFTVESFPGEVFEGTIAFIQPELDPHTRTVQVRVNVPNPELRLKPGMFARGEVTSTLTSENKVIAPDLAGKWISPMHPEIVKEEAGTCDVCGMDLVRAEDLGYSLGSEEEKPLVIPASSVLRTGKRSVVYVRVPDTERPTFEGRDVQIGNRAGDAYVLLEGLAEGELVVSHGAFKIDSALQIVAKPSMMNPAPTPVPVMKLEISEEKVTALLPEYLSLQDALAQDSLEGAKTALQRLLEVAGKGASVQPLLETMLASPDLDGMRRPHFEVLSNAVIEGVMKQPRLQDGLYLMHCPMVYDDRGADWLQNHPDLLNPYFGAMMLRCGVTKDLTPTGSKPEEGHEH